MEPDDRVTIRGVDRSLLDYTSRKSRKPGDKLRIGAKSYGRTINEALRLYLLLLHDQQEANPNPPANPLEALLARIHKEALARYAVDVEARPWTSLLTPKGQLDGGSNG